MTNLSDREQLKEAVEIVEHMLPGFALTPLIKEEKEALQALLVFAQSHLSASAELPERKKPIHIVSCGLDQGNGVHCNKKTCDGCKDAQDWGYEEDDTGFNSCLDQVTPIVARLKAENEELRKIIEERSVNTGWAKVIGLEQEIDRLNYILSRMSKSAGVGEIESILVMNDDGKWCKATRKMAVAIHDSIMGEGK